LIFTLPEILILVAIAIVLARIFGYLIDKLKQPAVIGEILAGFLVGAYGLGALSGINFAVFGLDINFPQIDFVHGDFEIFAQLGILFLMFISGLETSLPKLKSMGKNSTYIAIGGVVVPLLLGILSGIYFGYSWSVSVVIGLTLIATSVGISVKTLMDLHILHTNSGITILGAAVIDDIIGIILLAFLLGVDSPLILSIKIIIFFIIAFYFGLKIMDKILDLGEKIRLPKAFLSITIAILLFYSFFATQCGITAIIGAFVAGLIIGDTIKSKKIIDDVKIIGYGFFVPLFFVWVGASVDLSAFSVIGLFALVIIFVSIIGKIVGCGLIAKLTGMSTNESLLVGTGMIPRLEMAIITATTAQKYGLLSGDVGSQVLATTLLVCIVTALVTPILIKIVAFKGRI
jgi:Kef-type K+ transport system membrane component KefB